MSLDLNRLRELAKEPSREAMPRTGQFPSMTAEVLRQKQEISALRRGLADAISEIELLREQIESDALTHKEEVGYWQEQGI